MILTKEQVEEIKRDAWELKYPEAKELVESHEALRSALNIANARITTDRPIHGNTTTSTDTHLNASTITRVAENVTSDARFRFTQEIKRLKEALDIAMGALEKTKAALGDRLLARGPLSDAYASATFATIDAALAQLERVLNEGETK